MKNAAYRKRHQKEYKLFKKEVQDLIDDMPKGRLTRIKDFLPAPEKIILSHNKHRK